MAVTDHDGLYAAVEFAEAARPVGLGTVFGAELSLGLDAPQGGNPDPAGEHLLVLARSAEGYRRLAKTITAAQMRGQRGRPVYEWAEIVGQRRRPRRRALGDPDRLPQRRGARRAAGRGH